MSFDAKKPMTITGEPQRTWEVKLAWTEYTKGSWAPKRASAGGLVVNTAGVAPSPTQFRIDPLSNQSRLTLLVSFSQMWEAESTVIGGFGFCEDQIALLTPERIPGLKPTATFASYFQKLTYQKFDLKLIPTRGDGRSVPLFFLPAKVTDRQSIAWTVSKGPTRTTGLILSTKKENGTYLSYFTQPKLQLLETGSTEQFLIEKMDLVTMDHTFAHKLVEAAIEHEQPLIAVYNMLSTSTSSQLDDSFGSGDFDGYHELAKPSAIYNWEVGLHAILLGVDRFLATQQFEEALQVARLVFDPTIDRTTNGSEQGGLKSCWRFPPFQAMADIFSEQGEGPPSLTKLSTDLDLAIQERRSYGSLVHAAARGRPQTYMKWIVMKYAEILIASGDVHFRRGTLESLPLAIQRYVEAVHILGPEPPKIPKLGNRKAVSRSFATLKKEDEQFELGLPFSPELQARAVSTKKDSDTKRERIMSVLKTPYFCVPLNPKFKQMRTTVRQRLFNIRNSLDIQGRPVVYALREPPIDPGALVALSKLGLSNTDVLSAIIGDQDSPLPTQRFESLVKEALDFCSELRGFSERLLSAIEHKEAEALSVIQARHTTAVQKMMLDIKQTSLQEAEKTIETLNLTRNAQISQLKYFLALIGEPKSKIPIQPSDNWDDIEQDIDLPTKDDLRMSSYEKLEMDLAQASTVLGVIAAGIDAFVSPVVLTHEFEMMASPLGVGVNTNAGGGGKISKSMELAAHSMRMAGTIVTEQGARAGRKAALTKQLQERRLQANMIGHDIKNIDKQLEAQQIRVQAARLEIEMQKLELSNSSQMEEYYRTKYTTEQLYGWMEKNLRDMYFQAYTLVMSTARRAESSLSFEQGQKVSILRAGGYWDSSRDGLLSADDLYLDLKRLEVFAAESNSHDFEVTKTVSLKQIDPLALVKLRNTGSTMFSVNELQFDMDFAGHYMRRLRAVAVSIPAAAESVGGLNATLTLMEHKYRVNSTASDAADYKRGLDGEAFRTDRVPISSVAISSGVRDAGVFELDFGGASYMPFEGAGAISTWSLQLPTEIRQFDYETIGDVVLHLQYTALDGGSALRAAANGAVRAAVSATKDEGTESGFWAIFDLKSDIADEWKTFSARLLAAKKDDGDLTLKFGNLSERLPFYARSRPGLTVRSIGLISRSSLLVSGLTLSVVPKASSWTSRVIGQSTMRSIEGLGVTGLDNWTLQAPATLLSEVKPNVRSVENVYMVFNYVFTDGKKTL